MLRKRFYLFNASVSLISLVFFLFVFFCIPQLEIKAIDAQLGVAAVYAGDLVSEPAGPVPPEATNNNSPSGILRYAWSRMNGRADAVYLNIPSSQLSNASQIASSPSPMIFGKFNPTLGVGTLALMRMHQDGAMLKADIVQLTPKNFHHSMGIHLYNFAWLDFNASCAGQAQAKALSDSNSPNVDNARIIHDFTQFDMGNTLLSPVFSFSASEQAAINLSNSYWHQRLNNDPCWSPAKFSDADAGDGDWHNLSLTDFMNVVALATQLHKAGAAFVAVAKISQNVNTSSHGSFFTKTVTTTVSYNLSPDWYVGTKAYKGYADAIYNPTYVASNDVAFVHVEGQGANFPVDPIVVYQWSQSVSGLTGLFVFLVCIVIFAVGGGALGYALGGQNLAGAAIGAAVGAVAGVVAAGGSPTTGTIASITPFVNSSFHYTLPSMSGDAQIVAGRIDPIWLDADNAGGAPQPIDQTPGGVGSFVVSIDARKALACGGASQTAACTNPAVTQIGPNDPRWKTVYDSMFHQPAKDMQNSIYPYTQR